jgi:predicted permease
MATIHSANPVQFQLTTILARTLLVALTLATAAIHTSLGGLLFTMNAVAYAALAVAMVIPGPAAQFRWLIRLALMGFAAATIGGWLLFGARFPLAYLDKAIEVALIAVVAFELWHSDGGPIPVARRLHRLVTGVARALLARA